MIVKPAMDRERGADFLKEERMEDFGPEIIAGKGADKS
jgi:hypothetical protein